MFLLLKSGLFITITATHDRTYDPFQAALFFHPVSYIELTLRSCESQTLIVISTTFDEAKPTTIRTK